MRYLFIIALALSAGCKEIKMGLFDSPPTRNETYTDATPVNPNTMNDLQDAAIRERTGLRTMTLHFLAGFHVAASTTERSLTGTFADIRKVGSNANPFNWIWAIPVEQGWYIEEVRFIVQDHATGPCKLTGEVMMPTSTLTQSQGTDESDGSGAVQTLTVPVNRAVAAGESMAAQLYQTAGGAQTLYAMRIEIDYRVETP